MNAGIAAVREMLRVAFARLEHADPADVDQIVIAVVAHLRAIRPEQFGCLSQLPPPGEPIRDPRLEK